MRRFLKWAGIGLALMLLGALGLIATAWAVTNNAMSRNYAINDPPLHVAATPEAVQRGKHLFDTRGCGDCHGPQGAARLPRLISNYYAPSAFWAGSV